VQVEDRPVVCPICLMPAAMCRTCRLVEYLSFSPSLSEGVTKTRALSLRHPVVCSVCRRPQGDCSFCLGRTSQCAARKMSLQAFFPTWFRWDDLVPADKEYVHHANGVQS
jgi:hypothetical protein